MLKRVDNAVYDAFKLEAEDLESRHQRDGSGQRRRRLRDGRKQRQSRDAEMQAAVDAAAEKIKSGELVGARLHVRQQLPGCNVLRHETGRGAPPGV
jgi:basic membrane protein A and related proteins